MKITGNKRIVLQELLSRASVSTLWGFEHNILRLSAVIHDLRHNHNVIITDYWATPPSGKKYKMYHLDFKGINERRKPRQEYATDMDYFKSLSPVPFNVLDAMWGAAFNKGVQFDSSKGAYYFIYLGTKLTSRSIENLFMKFSLTKMGIRF